MKTAEFLKKEAPRLEAFLQERKAPCYVYDMESLKTHAAQLKKEAPLGVRLFYATKANPLSAILKTFSALDFSFDVASSGELEQVIKHSQNSPQIIVTGPAKSRSFLKQCLDSGVRTFVIESETQLKLLNQLCQEKKREADVLLRVQFAWSGTHNKILGGDQITPFGLSPLDWEALDLKNYPALVIKGLHAFQWGNITSQEELSLIWKNIFLEAKKLSEKLQLPLDVLDLGGGLGLDYTTDNSPLSFVILMDTLSSLRKEFSVPEVWLELGRYLTGPFGYLCTPIVERKKVRGQEQLILASGINHQARIALTGTAFPAQSLRASTLPTQSFHLYGPLCTALDFLGQAQLPQDMQSEEWIIFSLAGAYGFTESMPFFLCHEGAGEACLYDDNIELLRAPQKAAEWLR